MAPPGTDFDVSFWRDVEARAHALGAVALRAGLV